MLGGIESSDLLSEPCYFGYLRNHETMGITIVGRCYLVSGSIRFDRRGAVD